MPDCDSEASRMDDPASHVLLRSSKGPVQCCQAPRRWFWRMTTPHAMMAQRVASKRLVRRQYLVTGTAESPVSP
jgi:hypothetical protein